MTDSGVTFDYATWIVRYPEFSNTVGSALAQLYFNEATLFFGGCRDTVRNSTILNMITAHIAALNAGTNGEDGASPLVGRIGTATEGSVSVSTSYGTATSSAGSAVWFQQTKYGAEAWQAMAPYRLGGRYTPGNVPYLGVNRWYSGNLAGINGRFW